MSDRTVIFLNHPKTSGTSLAWELHGFLRGYHFKEMVSQRRITKKNHKEALLSNPNPHCLIEEIQSKLTQPDLTKTESIGDRLSLNYLALCHEELSSNNQFLNCTWKLTSNKHSSWAVVSYG